MSVNLKWHVYPAGRDLPGGSTDKEVLEATFGEFPLHLNMGNHSELEAMGRVAGKDSVYARLAALVMQHDPVTIVVEARY